MRIAIYIFSISLSRLSLSFRMAGIVILMLVFSFTGCKQGKVPDHERNIADILSHADHCLAIRNYDSALLLYRHAVALSMQKRTAVDWTRGTCGIIECYRKTGNEAEAMELAEHAPGYSKGLVDTASVYYAALLNKKAALHANRGEYELSALAYSQSIELCRKYNLPGDTLIAAALNGQGSNYFYSGRYDEALRHFLDAISIYENLKLDNSPDYALFLQNAGIVYSVKGDYTLAEKHFKQSLEIYSHTLPPGDPEMGLLFLNTGRFYSIIGRDDRALELYGKSETILKSSPLQAQRLIPLYINMGLSYILKADFEKARSYYNQALVSLNNDSVPDPSSLLTVYLNLGLISEKQGDYREAETNYLKGLAIGEEFPNAVKLLRGLAYVNYELKQFKAADGFYRRAISKSRATFGNRHAETAISLMKYGEFLSLSTRNKQSITYLLEALKIYKGIFGNKNRDVEQAYNYLGNYYFRNRQFEKALEYYQQSLISGFRTFDASEYMKNPEISNHELNSYQLISLNGKAGSLMELYLSKPEKTEYLGGASAAYTIAVGLLEQLRSAYQNEESKLQISGSETATLSKALQTEVMLYRLTGNGEAFGKAFGYAEKGKSAILLSNLRELGAKESGMIPPDIRESENAVRSRIAFYNKAIYDEKSKSNADAQKIMLWNKEVFRLNRVLDSLLLVIRNDYPAFYALKYNHSVITPGEIAKRIPANQALIEYSFADSLLLIFAITREGARLQAVKLTDGFRQDLDLVIRQNRGEHQTAFEKDDLAPFARSSYRLYQALISPVKDLTEKKELLIIPDGQLGYLPFDVLLTRMPDTVRPRYRNLPYLIRESAISYAPSATSYFEALTGNNHRGNGKAAVFVPDYSGISNLTVSQLTGTAGNNGKLAPLAGAGEEADFLASKFKSSVFMGKRATEENFKTKAGPYSILHLGMHTLLDNENPLYSKLVFQQNQQEGEDGFLNTSELFSMALEARMAVLSACNTGSGKIARGEGIMSLSRGFFYAGVPSVVMSAWTIEDRSGPELMERFYRHLSEGMSKSQALRLSKLEYLEHTDQLKAHPHYWAAYMSIGDNAPITGLRKPGTPRYLIIAIAIAAGAALFTFGIRRMKRRKRDRQMF